MSARHEPVTYWLVISDRDKVLDKAHRIMLTDKTPDGLLFRVSSIDPDAAHAFAVQHQFVADMMTAVPTDARRVLSGLTPAGAT